MKRWIYLAARLVLGIMFLAACLPKILHPHEFALMLFRYQMLPYSCINLIAIFMPWIELIAALALLWPRYSEGATVLLLGMLLVFTTAIVINLFRGINMACGCFSVDPNADKIGWWKVAENSGFILIALLAWVGTRTRTALAR